MEAKRQTSAVTRINNALKAAGRDERLVRGRGYYYLREGEASAMPATSIYTYELGPEDFEWARTMVNHLYADAGMNVVI